MADSMSDNNFYRQFSDSDNVSDDSFSGFKLETLPTDESEIDLDISVRDQKLLDRLLSDEFNDLSTPLPLLE